jgi:hypothetical protein
VPVEVAVTNDLTRWKPDTSPLHTHDDKRPRGGLLATAEIKTESYAHLMALLLQRGFAVRGALPAQVTQHDQEPGELPFSENDVVANKRVVYPLYVLDARGQRIAVPKIYTVVLGAMGSVTHVAVDALDAVGVRGVRASTLFRELQDQLISDLLASRKLFVRARGRAERAGTSSSNRGASSPPPTAAARSSAHPPAAMPASAQHAQHRASTHAGPSSGPSNFHPQGVG